jgi:hypothetical protein
MDEYERWWEDDDEDEIFSVPTASFDLGLLERLDTSGTLTFAAERLDTMYVDVDNGVFRRRGAYWLPATVTIQWINDEPTVDAYGVEDMVGHDVVKVAGPTILEVVRILESLPEFASWFLQSFIHQRSERIALRPYREQMFNEFKEGHPDKYGDAVFSPDPDEEENVVALGPELTNAQLRRARQLWEDGLPPAKAVAAARNELPS